MGEKGKYHGIPGLTAWREANKRSPEATEGRQSKTLRQIAALSRTLGRTARDVVTDEEKALKVAVFSVLGGVTFGAVVVVGTLAYMSINQRATADRPGEQSSPRSVSTPSWSYQDILQEQPTPTVLPVMDK